MTEKSTPHLHGSWFGVGDGTVIMWPLVWTLLPIGLFAIISLIWATKTGQFRDIEKIAERQLELED
ncbi:MAG: cbb3-type cytochrome oxidase assembly protein [Richelia sp. SM1_7_0]|nr:cbb3-type cytochrome oxidase assembly protein [Richelia sp. SM1_7_0]